jgi:hypothetical protein
MTRVINEVRNAVHAKLDAKTTQVEKVVKIKKIIKK